MPNDTPVIDIQGRCRTFHLYLNGKKQPQRFRSREDADLGALRLQLRLDKAAITERACMCCGKTFGSAHRFNRLCPQCSSGSWPY